MRNYDYEPYYATGSPIILFTWGDNLIRPHSQEYLAYFVYLA
jgi:hypothetical protein